MNDIIEFPDNATVLDILEQAPARLAAQAVNVSIARESLSIAKHKLEIAKSNAVIANQQAKNQKILDAYVVVDEEVKQCQEKCILARGEFEIQQIAHGKLYDTFLSARKIAGMDDQELHALRGTTIRKAITEDSQGNHVDPYSGEIMNPGQ